MNANAKGTAFDWAKLYSSGTLSELPQPSSYDVENGNFRDLFLTWSKLPNPTADTPPMWFICCDVLALDEDVVLDRPVFVFARRIEVANDAALMLDRTAKERSPDLTLFAQEVVDRSTGAPVALKITALTGSPSDPAQTDRSFAPHGAAGLSWPSDHPQPTAITVRDLDPAHLVQNEPLRLLLTTTFQAATLLSTEDASLSLDQLRWIAGVAQANAETQELALQAAAMANTLSAERTIGANAVLVPRLDMAVYGEAARNFMAPLEDCQSKWDALQRMKAEDGNWANAAKDSLALEQNQADLVDKLLLQALGSRERAIRARDLAAGQVMLEKALLAECETVFEAGIRKWKLAQDRRAVLDIVTGTAQILQQVPAIIAAGPEVAAPMVAQGAGAASALVASVGRLFAGPPTLGAKTKEETEAEEQAEAEAAVPYGPKTKAEADAEAEVTAAREEAKSKLKSSLGDAAGGAKQVVDAVMQIAAITEQAAAMESSSRDILKQVGETITGAVSSSFELQGRDVVTGGATEWELLKTSIDAVFEDDIAPLKDIDGGPAYRTEFHKLIVCGEALSEARLAVAKTNSQVAELKLRSEAAKKAVTMAKDRVQHFAGQLKRDATLAQLAFDKVLDAKRSVYLALENYRRAFEYATLTEPPFSIPALTQPVQDFSKAVAQVSSRLLSDNALNPAPGSMRDPCVTLADPALLASVKSSGVLTWVLSPTDPAFAPFGRIRWTGVRVFVRGIAGKVEVQIATSGVYVDKLLTGGTRQFVGEPMRKVFVYDASESWASGGHDDPKVIFDADIAVRYRDDFFNATPFTAWTIRIKRYPDDRPLDLKELGSITALEMHLSGVASPIT